MIHDKYNWEYLTKEIKKHYKTFECFVDSLEDEKRLGISYDTFRTQKTRKSKKYLEEYTDFIIEQHGTHLDRLKIILTDIFDGFFALVNIKKSITLKNTGSTFQIQKSWTNNDTETFNINDEFVIFLDGFTNNEVLNEIFEENEIIQLIIKKIKIYIEKKIILFDFIKFTLNKQTVDVEIRFNKTTTSISIDKEVFEEIATSFPTDMLKDILK